MSSLSDILKWSRLVGSTWYLPSQQGSLLTALGAETDTTIEEFAAIPVDNFSNVIENMWFYSESFEPEDQRRQVLEVTPTEIVKARARSAHHAARIWVGAETTRAYKARRLDHLGTQTQEYRDAKLAALVKAAEGSGTARSSTEAIETVPINEVADTTQKREIAVMSPEKYRVYYKQYRKWTHVDPKPSITPTRAQLSVLLAILASGTCYVDMALWGAYQGRSARAMRCEGLIPGPEGTQVRADFKGPPDFDSWHQCFVVYMVAMIMLDQVLPPWLQTYIDFISEYNTLYGYRIWAFLYQTDVRFRSEHLPYMAIRESDKLEAALMKDSTTDYNPLKPWGFLWRLAVDTNDTQESRWWYREFERKIPMLLDQGMAKFIGGDARISSTPDGHFATTHNAVNVSDKERADTSFGGGGGGGKKRTGGGGGKSGGSGGVDASIPPPPATFTKPNQPIAKTKKGAELCIGYNAGKCTGGDGGKCPSNDKRRHLCHWCLGNHPASTCAKGSSSSGDGKGLDARRQRGRGGKAGKGGRG